MLIGRLSSTTTCQDALSPWKQTLSINLPYVSRPQTTVFAFWSVARMLRKNTAHRFNSTSGILRGDTNEDQSVLNSYPVAIDQRRMQMTRPAKDDEREERIHMRSSWMRIALKSKC